jgi:hypothetical protein
MSKLDLSVKASLIKPLSWEKHRIPKNKNVMVVRSFINGDAQRTGLYAGWVLAFRLPGPLLIENILMKLKLMLNIVCPARTDGQLCNLLKFSLSSPICIKPHVSGRFVFYSFLFEFRYLECFFQQCCQVFCSRKNNNKKEFH